MPAETDVKFLLGACVVLLVALAIYVYFTTNEPEISLTEFRSRLNSTASFTVIQDLRTLPANDTAARQNLQNCGVQVSFVLSYLGKNVTNYAYEGDTCTGGEKAEVRTIKECANSMKQDGRYVFTLSYSATDSTTKFYNTHATYSGEAAFLQDCAISKIVR